MSTRAQEVMAETWERICKLEALMWQVDGLNSTEDPEQQERQAWLISMAYDEILRLKKFVGSIDSNEAPPPPGSLPGGGFLAHF